MRQKVKTMTDTIDCPGCGKGKVKLSDFRSRSTARCTRGCELEDDNGNLRKAGQASSEFDEALKGLSRTINFRL